jgi:signal transduction histidine kinase
MEYHFSIYSVGNILSGIFVLLLGFWVYFKKRQSSVNRNFFYLAFMTFIWLIFYGVSYLSTAEEQALLFLKIGYTGVIFMAVAGVQLVSSFTNFKIPAYIYVISYIINLVSVYLLYFTNYFINGLYQYFWGYYPRAGSLHPFFLTFFVSAITIFIGLLFIKWLKVRKEKSAESRRVLYMFIAVSSISFAAVDFIPNYGIEIYPFGWVLVLFYCSTIAYTIVKYQLMDINIIIKKALIYSIGIAMVGGLMVGVSFLSGWFKENIPGFQFWIVPMAIGATAFVLGKLFYNKSQEAEKLKYEFITVAAHKLRTPLTEVKWAADALREKEKDNEKIQLVSGISSANSRLITLTDELLSIAKTEAGKYQYKFEAVDFEKMVRSAVNDFQHQMKEKNIKLTYNYDKNLPKINADKLRMSMVIQILIENAVQYTKDKIEINIKKDKKEIVFSIKDNGIGIPKEDLPYIFSRFYRTHEAYKTETEGAGLSLYLAKSIIDRHNGKIGVYSEGEGKGSEFWVRVKTN